MALDRPALNQPFIKELALESPATIRLLRRLPGDQLSWRPHLRSMSLGRLASHIAEIARYGTLVLTADRVDSEARTRGPLDLDSVEAIITSFETEAEEFAGHLASADDAALRERWQYCKGEHVIFDVRRFVALRTFVFNHLVHHRGQLTVYLRLLEVPLPQLYGPTADDQVG